MNGDGLIQRQSNTHRFSVSMLIPRLPKSRGEGGGDAVVKFAKITGHSGDESPFLYAGVTVNYDDSGARASINWVTDESATDDLGFTMINIAEIAQDGLPPVADGAIVLYWSMGDFWAFQQVNYRGTYP